MTKAADLLRRASREGCTLLLGNCHVYRVGPVMAAVIVEIGIVQAVVVMVGIVVALMWIVIVVVVVASIDESTGDIEDLILHVLSGRDATVDIVTTL